MKLTGHPKALLRVITNIEKHQELQRAQQLTIIKMRLNLDKTQHA